MLHVVYGQADSARAIVNEIRAKGITGTQLDQALRTADQAQKAADKAKNDFETAQRNVDTVQRTGKAIPGGGTMDSLIKASDSAIAASHLGDKAVQILIDAPASVAPASIVDAHLDDMVKKMDKAMKNIDQMDAAYQKADNFAKSSPAGSTTKTDPKKPAAAPKVTTPKKSDSNKTDKKKSDSKKTDVKKVDAKKTQSKTAPVAPKKASTPIATKKAETSSTKKKV